MAWWWQDRSGAFAPVRAVALAAAVAPALWLAWTALAAGLGPRPVTAAIHFCGDWAVRLLLASLTVSPLQRLLHWPRLSPARQVLGLASFAYAALHILLYVADRKFALGTVLSEIVKRVYLGIGSMAFIGLLILTVNSGTAAIQRLGSAEWRRLHKSVFVILPLALLHFFIQSKLEVTEPLVMTGLALWLIGYRLLPAAERIAPLALAGLAVAAALGTQLVELVWYALATKVSTSDIASGIFDFGSEIRPMWIVLAATLPLSVVPILSRGRQRGGG